MSYHFIVQHIASLGTVNDLTLLVIAHTRDFGYSFMEIHIKIGVFRFNALKTKSFESLMQLLIDKFPAFFKSLFSFYFGSIGYSSFHIIKNRKNCSDNLFSTIKNQFSFLSDGTFLVILEFGQGTQIFVFSFGQFLIKSI